MVIEDLIDAILEALPFVEDAMADPAYKKGAVKKSVNKIRKAIEVAEIKLQEDKAIIRQLNR